MNKRLAGVFGAAVLVVAVFIAIVFYVQRGSHLVLQGQTLKVRTAPLDERSCVVVLDFRSTNPADFTYTVRSVSVVLEDASGMRIEGTTTAEVDAQRLFESLPLLGQKYNKSLIGRDEIPAHASRDYMIAARFEVPEAQVDKRKAFVIQVTENSGIVSEIRER
jgi:hypothetical protein